MPCNYDAEPEAATEHVLCLHVRPRVRVYILICGYVYLARSLRERVYALPQHPGARFVVVEKLGRTNYVHFQVGEKPHRARPEPDGVLCVTRPCI